MNTIFFLPPVYLMLLGKDMRFVDPSWYMPDSVVCVSWMGYCQKVSQTNSWCELCT